MFEKPFRPFSWDLWALILGFLVFCGIINAVCDYANSEVVRSVQCLFHVML
jgi:hypothetical protein